VLVLSIDVSIETTVIWVNFATIQTLHFHPYLVHFDDMLFAVCICEKESGTACAIVALDDLGSVVDVDVFVQNFITYLHFVAVDAKFFVFSALVHFFHVILFLHFCFKVNITLFMVLTLDNLVCVVFF